jgi:hypothetical protein
MIYYTYAEENDSFTNLSLAFPPEKLDYPINERTKFCPALRKNKDWWVIKAPYTYHLKHSFTQNGETEINLLKQNSFNDNKFDKLIMIHPKDRRNSPDIPTLQLSLYIAFFTKEKNVTMEIFPAFMNHELNKQPLVSVYGTYPISDWVRTINFAFDWIKPDKEILIKRGSPLLYVRFSNNDSLKQTPLTPELTKQLRTCGAMADHYKKGDWKWMFKHMRTLLWK